jgi:integrase
MDTQYVGDLSFVTRVIVRLFDIQRQQPLDVRNDLWLRKFEIGIQERSIEYYALETGQRLRYRAHDMNQRPTTTIALCGIKFFIERTLGKQWTSFDLIRPPREKKLPVILSIEEVQTILRQVRLPRYRVCLSTVYSGVVRLQEGTHIQVRDIDSGRGKLPDPHKGKLAEGPSNQGEATESRRVTGHAGH